MKQFNIIKPKDLPWENSLTGAAGCFAKTIFAYSDHHITAGESGAYTGHYRFDPGAKYPPVHIVHLPCELFITSGTFLLNGKPVTAGNWVQVLPDEDAAIVFSSEEGCEVIGFVRGGIRKANESSSLKKPESLSDPINPDTMPWVESPTGAPGCAGKKVFIYDSGGYTCHYRFAPGAAYPPVQFVGQPCELYVTSGILLVNNKPVPAGSWVQVLPDDTAAIVFSSEVGCEVISIVRGTIRKV